MNDNDYTKVDKSQNGKKSQNNLSSLDEFANVLPDWDLLPPSLIIRRVKRNK